VSDALDEMTAAVAVAVEDTSEQFSSVDTGDVDTSASNLLSALSVLDSSAGHTKTETASRSAQVDYFSQNTSNAAETVDAVNFGEVTEELTAVDGISGTTVAEPGTSMPRHLDLGHYTPHGTTGGAMGSSTTHDGGFASVNSMPIVGDAQVSRVQPATGVVGRPVDRTADLAVAPD
jgi:hypothetical protein